MTTVRVSSTSGDLLGWIQPERLSSQSRHSPAGVGRVERFQHVDAAELRGPAQVAKNSTLPDMGVGMTAVCWLAVLSASLGLVLLYRITVGDPGYLPRSTGSSSAARSKATAKNAPVRANKQPLDLLLGRCAARQLRAENADANTLVCCNSIRSEAPFLVLSPLALACQGGAVVDGLDSVPVSWSKR